MSVLDQFDLDGRLCREYQRRDRLGSWVVTEVLDDDGVVLVDDREDSVRRDEPHAIAL